MAHACDEAPLNSRDGLATDCEQAFDFARRMTALLAFDTASERMTIALSLGDRRWSQQAAGGAKASATLVPSLLGLLREAGLSLRDLDAIAFGRGPGAFTGLRAACSVAQGLALGAGKPVVPIDNLLAVAEEARAGAPRFRVWAVIDARMDQIYAAEYGFEQGRWATHVPPMLTDAEQLRAQWRAAPPEAVAGDALPAFGARLETGDARRFADARTSGDALLTLAGNAWQDGLALDPARALPFYVRDKVASTTSEREAARAGKAEAG